MIDLDYKIVRIRAAELKQRATVILVKASLQQDVVQMIKNNLPDKQVPSATPVMLCWIGNELFSNDSIQIEKAIREDFNLLIEILVTKMNEPIHANVVSVPVIQIFFDQLKGGSYHTTINEKKVNKNKADDSSITTETLHEFSFVVK